MPGQKSVKKTFADPSAIGIHSVLVASEYLTQVMVGMRSNNFVMQNVLPDIGVVKDTDLIPVLSPKGFFKVASRRADTSLPEQGAPQFTQDSYACDEFAMEGWVGDDAIRNAIVQLDPLARETEFLTKRILLAEEVGRMYEIFGAIKAAGASHYDILGGTANWNGGADSDPLGDVSRSIKLIVSRTGVRPNLVSLSTDGYEAFINNEQVLDILKRQTAAAVESSTPVNTIRGMRLQIADAIVNEGTLDTPSFRNIQYDVNTSTQFFDTVLVAFVDANDPLTLGHNFVSKPLKAWTGRGLEGDRRQATLVYASKKFGPKITNVGAGHIIAKILG